MFTKMSILKRKIRGATLRVFNAIENNGNADFESNGEKLFIDKLLNYFSKNDACKVVFDIGANIGDYSAMIKEQSSKLDLKLEFHLFEPTKRCYEDLKNKFNTNDFVLNNFGASNKDGFSTIFYDKEKSGLASLYPRNLDAYDLKLSKSEEIILRRLDEYIEDKGVKHIDFVKIDIEGHELKAFEGFGSYLNREFIDFIQFEYGGANLDSHSSLMEIYAFLNDKGFVLAKVMTKGLEIRKYSPFMDNFQYANYVAISERVINDIFCI